MHRVSRKDDKPEAILEAYIASHGGRRTPERRAILSCALSMGHEFGIADLIDRLAREGMPVSRATVYSSLALMHDAGILDSHRIEGAKGRVATLYSVRQASKTARRSALTIHSVCRHCGRIRRLSPDPELERQLRARRFGAFAADELVLNAYGLCSRCKSKKPTPSSKSHNR